MIKELRTQHRTIIQMSFSGFKNHEIAEKLEMAQSTISTILRSPLAQAYMGGLHDKSKENTLDVRKQLISMNSSALAAFERILSPHEKAPYNVQFSTAKDILDRNGFKPTDKINIDMTLQAKSDDEIDAEITAMQNSIARSASVAKVAKATEQTDETESIVESSDTPSSPSTIPTDTQPSEDSPIDLASSYLADEDFTADDLSSDSSLADISIDPFPPK